MRKSRGNTDLVNLSFCTRNCKQLKMVMLVCCLAGLCILISASLTSNPLASERAFQLFFANLPNPIFKYPLCWNWILNLIDQLKDAIHEEIAYSFSFYHFSQAMPSLSSETGFSKVSKTFRQLLLILFVNFHQLAQVASNVYF